MIDLPDLDRAFEHENAFYLSCSTERIRKQLAQWELFRQSADVPGAIVECGVFKGASMVRLAMFRQVMGLQDRALIGFDTFSEFPEAGFEADRELRERFVAEAGDESISVEQMQRVLVHKSLDANVQLVAGDITRTVPDFIASHPDLQISFLHVDVDLYEPSRVIFEHLYPRVASGGIVMLDDYGTFPGETQAADEALGPDLRDRLQSPTFGDSPLYLVKN